MTPISIELKRLNHQDFNALRLVHIFSKYRLPNNYQYMRFKGTSSLSTNLEAWHLHCGLISYNMDYTKHFSNSHSLKGLAALKYLSKHNRHYQNLQLNKNLFNLVESTDQRPLGNLNGELFLKVINQRPNKSAGLDDFTFNRCR